MGGRKRCGIKQVVACALLRLTTPRNAGRLSILPGGRFSRRFAVQGGRNNTNKQEKPEVAVNSQVAVRGGYFNMEVFLQ